MTAPLPLLYDPRIAAKSVDPWPSHKAAEQARGLARQHHKLILEFLDTARYPAHYRQIAAGTGLEPVAIGRRLIELERAHLIERAGTGPLGNGRVGTTWRRVG